MQKYECRNIYVSLFGNYILTAFLELFLMQIDESLDVSNPSNPNENSHNNL